MYDVANHKVSIFCGNYSLHWCSNANKPNYEPEGLIDFSFLLVFNIYSSSLLTICQELL